MYADMSPGYIPNPSPTLTQTWNDCLRQCGKQLTAILIDYHSQTHQKLLSEIQTRIQTPILLLT